MIKKAAKRTLKFGWRVTKPIRRPAIGMVERWIDRAVVIAAHEAVTEANLAIDFAAADLARMQAQVDAMIATLDRSHEGLAVVGS